MTKALNELMEFGHCITVHDDGSITDSTERPYVELSCYLGDADEWHDNFQLPDGWTLLRGFTGQYSYNGPVMHSSEYIGGGLERHIRETPGHYVALIVESDCGGHADYCGPDAIETGCDCEPAGWAIAYKELQEQA